MSPDQWNLVRNTFDKAVELPPGERDAFLSRVCGQNAELKAEVESLLVSLEDSAGFIETPASTDTIEHGAPAVLPQTFARAGTTIGAYRIVQVLGEGGMGTVYQAVRVDDLYRKLVAVKVLKAGLNSEYAIRKFETERQILAHLDHPNIARLLDGGATADGQLYFVMDFIGGIPIDEYCDKHLLGVRERLTLFLTVCSAVHYAHQNLIIHRDLKPQNILVTGDGTVRLLDFGIAKLLDPDHEETRDLLSTMVMMTPQYASPEQLHGDAVTTATDIYSMGVLLYQLLTGHMPFPPKRGSVQAIFEGIRSSEPRKPSSVVRVEEEGTLPGNPKYVPLTPPLVSERRGVKADRLARQLSGDLDNILLMALQYEPQRRYSSVEQFLGDIQRHLNEIPVRARPDTIRYRSVKFVRRHTAAVVGAAFFILALLGGIAATSWEARVARAERARAEQRFNEVRELANSVLFDLHDAIETLPGSTAVRELLVKKARHYLDHLATDPSGDDDLNRERAAAYERIGDVLGLPVKSNLGDTKGALASYDTALSIERSLLAAHPGDDKLQGALVRTLSRVCSVEQSSGRFQDALKHCGEMLVLQEGISEAARGDSKRQAELAAAYQTTAGAWFAVGDWAKSESYRARALAILQELHRADPANENYESDIANAYLRMANVQEQQKRLQPARENAERAVMIFDRLSTRHPSQARRKLSTSFALQRLGSVLIDLGDMKSARDVFLRAVPIREQLVAIDPMDASARVNLSNSLAALGYVDLQMNKPGEGLQNFQRQKAIAEQLVAADPLRIEHQYSLSEAIENIGRVALFHATKAGSQSEKQKYLAEARTALRQALQIYEDLRARNAISAEYGHVPKRIEEELQRCERL